MMKTIFSFLVLVALFSNHAFAQSVKVTVSEDAFVQGGETANVAMGVDKETQLRVSNSKANSKYARKTYLKFNVPNNTKKVKTIVLNLLIKVFELDTDPNAKFKLEVFSVNNNDWKENKITWNNAPEVSLKVGSVEIGQSQDKKNKWQQIQLDADMINQLLKNQKGNTITLALLNNDFNKTSAIGPSKESSKKTGSYLTIE